MPCLRRPVSLFRGFAMLLGNYGSQQTVHHTYTVNRTSSVRMCSVRRHGKSGQLAMVTESVVTRLPEPSGSNIWSWVRNQEPLCWRRPAANYWTEMDWKLRCNKHSAYVEIPTPPLVEEEAPLLSTCLEDNKNPSRWSRRDLKPRMTLLARASSNLTDRPICAHVQQHIRAEY
jgi:hypothetical protein